MKRRIEITEELINDGHHTHVKGDIVSIQVDKANDWISWGWARDPDTGEQGERIPGPVKASVNSVTQNSVKALH